MDVSTYVKRFIDLASKYSNIKEIRKRFLKWKNVTISFDIDQIKINYFYPFTEALCAPILQLSRLYLIVSILPRHKN